MESLASSFIFPCKAIGSAFYIIMSRRTILGTSETHNACSHIAKITETAIQTRKWGDLFYLSYFPAKRLNRHYEVICNSQCFFTHSEYGKSSHPNTKMGRLALFFIFPCKTTDRQYNECLSGTHCSCSRIVRLIEVDF